MTLNASGTVNRDLEFDGARFAANSPILAVYRFDSYRLTYRYGVLFDADALAEPKTF